MLDLGLAVAHHLLVFTLVATLFAERALLRAGGPALGGLSKLDAMYGGVSVLVIAVGVARVVWGGKGWAFYEANPFFWAKMATFLVIGLASVPPTMTFLKWSKGLKLDPAFSPDARSIAAAKRWTLIELALFAPLLAFAAAMARWPF